MQYGREVRFLASASLFYHACPYPMTGKGATPFKRDYVNSLCNNPLLHHRAFVVQSTPSGEQGKEACERRKFDKHILLQYSEQR